MSFTTSASNFRIPLRAASGVRASQLKLGNSTHKPTYSLSSSDQVTRYVYRSFFNATSDLQLFKGQKDLLYLVCLGLSFMILDINSWITSPGCFVRSMATCTFTRFPEEIFTNFAQICISDIFGVSFHLCQYIIDFCHGYIVSIMISLSSGNCIFYDGLTCYFLHTTAGIRRGGFLPSLLMPWLCSDRLCLF